MRLRYKFALCTTTVAATAVLAPLAPAKAPSVVRHAAAPLVRATYPGRGTRTDVPAAFLGVSQDWSSLPATIDNPAGQPSALYHALIDDLAAYGGGQPTLAVDGVTSWGRADNPASAFETVGRALAASEGVTRQQLVLGIDMVDATPATARAEITEWQSLLPSRVLRAYDLTDDVDATFSDACSDESEYAPMFRRFAARIEAAGVAAPLAGGCGYDAARTFVAAEHDALSMYVQHSYIGAACTDTGRPWPASSTQRPTIARILSPAAVFATAADNRVAEAVSHLYHLPFQLTDWQSYGCGGLPGVTNTFASTLWGLDEMFLDASEGVRGIDIHLTSPDYAPFRLTTEPDGVQAAEVSPLYYAMLLFAQATAHRAQILDGVSSAARVRGGANVRLWATRDRDGTLRFVVIDKDLHRSGRVQIDVRDASGAATVERLLASTPGTTGPVYLDGQTFGTGPTTTGQLTGNVVTQIVTPTHGTYTFYIRRATAAMLVVPPRPTNK